MRTEQPKIKVHLPDVVGKGYGTFWRFKGRYRVVKGSRASKKSKTTALWFIVNMMAYPDANTLVVRKTFRTLNYFTLEGRAFPFDDGSVVAIAYGDAQPVPTEDAELDRIQINLTVKEYQKFPE